VPLAVVLQTFQDAVTQCDSLVKNAHGLHPTTNQPLLPQIDREQITVGAFLNMFIAWETFLESAFAEYMTGQPTINGAPPIVKYVSPLTTADASAMLIAGQRFFDYSNHDRVRAVAQLFFQNGYPFEPGIAGAFTDLSDMKTMRNASAHISTSTQRSLESLAQRIFTTPQPSIKLYDLLTTVHPVSTMGETVFLIYKQRLEAAAALIATG
jgi:hypothetical protein